ncbi:hypothetical protein ACFQT0_26110 [Hymenobacter humi]|uniref:RHS repeat-associated core domain-containing protein n=1 Tax=Hymenobacter humi TaxID=1411620 RepID=A0ABW2UAA8_9BACT
MQTTNARNREGLVTTHLDWTGQPLQRVTLHRGPDYEPLMVQDFFAYDHTGRLRATRQQVGAETSPCCWRGGATTRWGSSWSTSLATGALAQAVDYAYNPRGWLTGLNNPHAPDPADLFNLSLHYERGFTRGYEQYSGNLTGQTWRGRDGAARLRLRLRPAQPFTAGRLRGGPAPWPRRPGPGTRRRTACLLWAGLRRQRQHWAPAAPGPAGAGHPHGAGPVRGGGPARLHLSGQPAAGRRRPNHGQPAPAPHGL